MEYFYFDIETGEGVSDWEPHERYDEMLDDVYGTVSIAGVEYATSDALKSTDPIFYRVEFASWVDSEIGETLTEGYPST